MITLDLHVHTIYSGDSPCEVEEAIRSAKRKGLDGIAITEHNTTKSLDEAFSVAKENDFFIIPGIEISSEHGHILGLGIEEKIPSDLPAEETVERIREMDGIAISAHPFSIGLKPFSLLNSDFDAVEIFNPRRYLGNSLAKKYATEKNLSPAAGSDAHYSEEIGMAGVELDCELELDSILKEIKKGKADVFGHYLPPSGFLRRALFRFSAYT